MLSSATETSSSNTLEIDKSEVIRALDILHAGEVVELRVLEAETAGYRSPHTVSGYFTDFEKLADAAAKIHNAQGFYITLNRINPALIARACNRAKDLTGKKQLTTSDNDVERRKFLLIDTDPKRPSGISSTDAQHDEALQRSQIIRQALSLAGWPAPIVADSGNGGHLLYLIDQPADDGGLVERVLKGLAAQFDTDEIKVDRTVHNPARICKLYGTPSGKGDSIPGYPHRLSKILDVPDEFNVVSNGLLEEIAKRPEASTPSSKGTKSAPQSGDTWIDGWIRDHHVKVGDPEPWQGGRRWLFDVCPFNDAHSDRSAVICQLADGGVAFKCHHDGCVGQNWDSLRNLIAPKAAAAGDRLRTPEQPTAFTMLAAVLDDPAISVPVERISTGFMDLDDVLRSGMVVGGMYVLAGATSHGKTTLGINITRRLVENGVKTLLITLEMTRIQIARCLLAAAAGLPTNKLELMTLGEADLRALATATTAIRGLPLAIDEATAELDAICLTIRAAAAQGFRVVVLDQMSWVIAPGKTAQERAALISRRLKAVAREVGVVLVLMCQVNRDGCKKPDGPELYDLRDSGTIEQDADGVLMISRVERFYNGKPAHMVLKVLKHRHGPMGDDVRVSLAWHMDQARIENYTGEYSE